MPPLEIVILVVMADIIISARRISPPPPTHGSEDGDVAPWMEIPQRACNGGGGHGMPFPRYPRPPMPRVHSLKQTGRVCR